MSKHLPLPALRKFVAGAAILVAWIAVALASIYIRGQLPISAIPDAGHDDGLFSILATHISQGHWLGDYTYTTLIKGPIFPLFVSLRDAIGVPLKIFEHLVYLLAAAAMAGLSARTARSWIAGSAVFVILASNPAVWTIDAQRVTRESLYVGLSLGVVAVAGWLLLADARRSGWVRILSVASFGVLLGLFWLTREEGLWLGPVLLVLVCGGLWRQWSLAGPPKFLNRNLPRNPLFQILTAAAVFGLVYGVVAGLNNFKYGVGIANELREGSFPEAYGAIQRIDAGDWQRFTAFTEERENILYDVSPTARELQPHLDLANPGGWRAISCSELHVDPCSKVYAVPFFVWALREAAWRAGKFESAPAAQQYFRRIASEINSACDAGQIRCLAKRSGMAPPFRPEYVASTIEEFWRGLPMLLRFGAGQVGWKPTSGSFEEAVVMSSAVGPLPVPGNATSPRLTLHGWAASPTSPPQLRVLDLNGGAAEADIELSAADDVVRHFRQEGWTEVHATRFQIETTCDRPTCALLAFADQPREESLRVSDLAVGGRRLDDGAMYIDWKGSSGDVYQSLDVENKEPLFAGLNAFGETYSSIASLLAWLVLPGLVLALVAAFRTPSEVGLAVLLIGCVAAVGARLALLSYMSASSWDAMLSGYLMPATPFAITAIVLSVYVTVRAILRLFGRVLTATAPQRTPPD